MFRIYYTQHKLRCTTLVIFGFIICFLQSLSLHAQPWQWAKSGGGFQQINPKETIQSIVTDSEGNVYFISEVSPINLKINGVLATGYGSIYSVNTALVSYTCDGNLRWYHIIGSTGISRFTSLQIDENDNIYIGGMLQRAAETYLSSTLSLPYSTQSNVHKEYLFLMKYNNLGDLLWHKTPHPDNVEEVTAISQSSSHSLQTDPQGNSYWLVRLPPGTYANGNFVNTIAGANLFILEYNTNGQFVEGHPLEFDIDGAFPKFDMIRNHNTGNFYIGGTVDLSETSITMGIDSIAKPMFFISFNENGDYLWKKENKSHLRGTLKNFVLDEDNNIYLSGATAINHITNAADTFAGAVLASSYIGDFPFIIKLDPQGHLLWSVNGETYKASSRAYAIALNTNEVAITGGYGKLYWDNDSLIKETNSGYDIFFAKFNKHNGELLDLNSIPSDIGYSEYGSALASDKFDNFYVGGRFRHYLYVNDTTTLLNNSIGNDYFLAKYGYNTNCNCDLPTPSFTNSISEGSVSFSYTGTSSYDQILWDFGNGDTSIVENPEYTFSTNEMNWVCISVTDYCGTAKYCKQVTAAIGVSELQGIDIDFFQNRVENYLSIIAENSLHFYIHNILGQQVRVGDISVGENIIDIYNIPEGSYLLTIKDQQGQKTTLQFIK